MSPRLAVVLMLLSSAPLVAQTREEKVQRDREKVTAEGFWIYNDLPRGFAAAKETGKPLLVVLRCIPCEECVKLDDELIDRDPVIRPLLEQFVCVRQVSTNGLDLGLFQYDTDQSFAVFMLNADGTIYGRFGTRSHRTDWLFDVSLPGLARALEGALELHRGYPANRGQLVGKRGEPLEFASPEKYPSLKDKYTDSLATTGSVVKSCIHCHQIGDAQRDYYRAAGKPIPEQLLFPYPHPKSLGLILDPEERAVVKSVDADSVAAKTGFQPGDQIVLFGGQPPLSIADIQWVLHRMPAEGGTVPVQMKRGDGRLVTVSLILEPGWRRRGDISWRVTTWGYRRMVTGGLKLEPAEADLRSELKLPSERMALRVEYVGKFGAHAAAKNAGVQLDDVVVSVDGKTDLMTETDLFVYGLESKRPGDTLDLVVRRGGKELQLAIPIQK